MACSRCCLSCGVNSAGSTPLSGDGALVEVLLRLRDGLPDGAASLLAVDGIVLDEDALLARGCSGQLTVSGDPIVVSSVSVAPAAVSLGPNTLQTFTATVVSNGVGGVTWSVWEGQAHGTISADGIYRSPAAPPLSGSAMVVATSLEDPQVCGTADVILLPVEEGGLVQLAALRNPAVPRGLQVWVTAAAAFLAAPQLEVAGDPVTVTAVGEGATTYLGQVLLPPGTQSVSITASGSTTSGDGEAALDVIF